MSKSNSQEKYTGMTVNERLYVSGLIEAFDKARDAGDRERMIQILIKAGLTSNQAKETVDELLS